MTSHEKRIWQALPVGMQQFTKVTMSYQQVLYLVNDHLKEIYGERADWKKCIKAYFGSDTYRNGCHDALNCENIPILSHESIVEMVAAEKRCNSKIEELIDLKDAIFHADSKQPTKEDTLRAAEILGILPERDSEALNCWLVDKTNMTEEERLILNQKIQDNSGRMSIAVRSLIDYYIEGFQASFPNVGTVITQRKGKYYYRGENAYYGTSKPSINRAADPNISDAMNSIINWLRLNEGCLFLDKFDAVMHWGGSDVNYLALAQHYGLRTPMMDVTSDLMTALFFACCKFGSDGKWHPLTKSEIEKKDSRHNVRKLGGDSRYGILYRTPTEITDMQWAVEGDKAGVGIVTPVGYQPFMRCSSQHGYMILISSEHYDMLRDKMFEKFKFELTEEFCKWVFDEMEQGNKVYPNDDVPDISAYMAEINKTHHFSQSVFELMQRNYEFSKEKEEILKAELAKYGYHIVEGNRSWITNNRLRKINRNYTIEKAIQLAGVTPVARPMFVMEANH